MMMNNEKAKKAEVQTSAICIDENHTGWGKAKLECNACKTESHPHYRYTRMTRNELIFEIDRLNAELAKKEEGIRLRGWWCTRQKNVTRDGITQSVPCDTFNGEEKELHSHCIHCNQPKTDEINSLSKLKTS